MKCSKVGFILIPDFFFPFSLRSNLSYFQQRWKCVQVMSQECWNSSSKAGSHPGGCPRGSKSEADSRLKRNITLKTNTQSKQKYAYKICSPVDMYIFIGFNNK